MYTCWVSREERGEVAGSYNRRRRSDLNRRTFSIESFDSRVRALISREERGEAAESYNRCRWSVLDRRTFSIESLESRWFLR